MKQYLSIIFIFCSVFCKAQYGNQDSVMLNKGTVAAPVLFPALVHIPANTSFRHPVIIYVPGRGHNGTKIKGVAGDGTQQNLMDNGPAYYLNHSWDGTAVNPITSQTEEFVIFSCRPGDYGLSEQNWHPFLQWLYYSSPYKDYIDTNRVNPVSLSAGSQGMFFYALNKSQVPVHKFNFMVLSSPEMNCCDPMNAFVRDSVRLLGTGFAPAGYTAGPVDGHAQSVQNEIKIANAIKSNYAQFTSNPAPNCCGVSSDGHCGCTWLYTFNPAWDTTYRDNNYNFDLSNQISEYQMMLLYSRAPTIVSSNTLSVTSVTTSPYCISDVAGKTISVSFSANYTPGVGNNYIVELSSPSGSFASPTILQTIPSTSATVTANITIPANTLGGTLYRIRTRSTNPAVISNPNSTNLTIILSKNSIAPTGTQNIAVNSNGTTLTGTFGSTPTSNQWYDGANPIAGATGSTYTPNFTDAGAHSVTLHSTYTTCATTVISNAVTINVAAAVSSSRHYLTKGADNGVYLNACNGYQYNPGDTFVLRASLNPYSYVTFWCFNDITVINEGGQVILTNFGTSISGGFEFKDCNRVHLTGTGSVSDYYGFNVTSDAYRGVGVNVYGRSSYFEGDHINAHNKNAGFRIKMEQTDDNCDTNYAFPRWYLHHMSIHDNYIHANAAESVYGLSTDPNGGRTSSTHYCNGVLDTLLAMRGYAFHIYNNYIDSNGRALQLAAADLDVSEINNNTVLHTGWDPDALQGNGISLGTYCRAYVHHNYINWSKKDGIQAFGAFNRIENNTVHNSGNDGFGHTTTASNIYVSSRNALYPSAGNGTYDSTQFIARDNDLDSNSSGWNVFVETGTGRFKTSGNLICNNTNDVDFVRPGINYSADCGGRQYVLIYTTKATTHDTASLATFHRTVFYDSVVTSFKDTTKSKFKNYKFSVRIATTTTKTFQLQRDSTYDSTVNYFTTHDSIFVDTQWINTNAFKLGAFYFGNGTVSITNQIDTVKNYLGMDYMRQNITRGGGAGYNVKQANDSGLHVVLTVNNSSDGATGFNTYLSGLVATDKPEVVCVGNEEALNATSLSGYISDLQTAISTLRPLGIKVSNGGITPDVAFYMYDYWNTHGKQDSALKLKQAFALNTTSQQATDAIATYKVLIPAYAASGMDFFNVHVHEPIRDTSITLISPWFPILINFLRERMGLGFMVGEFGTWNHNCPLLTDFVDEIFASGAEYAIYFDGTGNAGQDVKLQDCMKAIVSNLHAGNLVFQDEFDDINTTYWSKQAIHVDSIYSTTAFAHSGSNSAKFSYDYSDWTDDSTLQPQGHRTEIQGKGTAPPGQFALGSVYWLGFSTYFPSTWHVDPTNALIWQFHGKNGEDGNPVGAGAGGTPALSANVRPNQDSISVFVKYDSISPSQDGFLSLLHVPLVRNTWMNWVLQIKFDYTDGFVNAWVNGAQKCAYVGPTIYHSVNQASETGPYFKMGIYKAMWGTVPNIGQASNLTLYYDNLKIGSGFSSFNEVSP